MRGMKHPVGKCRYCGQELMSKQSLRNHEDICPQRQDEPEEVKPQDRWQKQMRMGNRTLWVPRND